MRPLLNYGAADTEALSGAHAGLSTTTVGQSKDISRVGLQDWELVSAVQTNAADSLRLFLKKPA